MFMPPVEVKTLCEKLPLMSLTVSPRLRPNGVRVFPFSNSDKGAEVVREDTIARFAIAAELAVGGTRHDVGTDESDRGTPQHAILQRIASPLDDYAHIVGPKRLHFLRFHLEGHRPNRRDASLDLATLRVGHPDGIADPEPGFELIKRLHGLLRGRGRWLEDAERRGERCPRDGLTGGGARAHDHPLSAAVRRSPASECDKPTLGGSSQDGRRGVRPMGECRRRAFDAREAGWCGCVGVRRRAQRSYAFSLASATGLAPMWKPGIPILGYASRAA